MGKAPAPLTVLDQLFPGQSFLDDGWPDRHRVSHGSIDRLSAISALPELSSLQSVLAVYAAPVRVALRDKRDEHSSEQVDAGRAAAAYGEGLALIFNGVERFLPVVADWLSRLRRELGLPAGCQPRSIVYATPQGAGNSPHFDANANFVVQLQGTKRWHVAPNRHVVNPTDRWAMNEARLSDALAGYVEGPLPTHLPDDAEVIDLAPGSVLFVPRGYWHATEADEDTLAINFTFGQPTWADLVLDTLRRSLLEHEAWRGLARDPSQLPGLLASLAREVESLEPGEVLAPLQEQSVWGLAPDAFLRVEAPSVFVSLGDDEVELELDEALLEVVEWIAEQAAPFPEEALALGFPTQADAIPGLLAMLEASGVLFRC